MPAPKNFDHQAQAQMEADVLRQMVHRRMTTRLWTPNTALNAYQAGWTEIQTHAADDVEREIKQFCGARGMPNVKVKQNEDGYAIKMTIPGDEFKGLRARQRLESLANLPEGQKKQRIAGAAR